MNKPIYVTRPSLPPYEEYCKEIADIWESRMLTNYAKKERQLTAALRDYLGVDDILMCVNGHMALELALESFDLSGEVITTPYTFVSTANAIVRSGLTPVFADVDRDTCCLNADAIEPLITEKTCAILPVHVYGTPCDTARIEQIAKKHGLKVIYDAAHAFGVTVNGVPIGRFGDAAMFSFHATKVFHTVEGGAVCINDPAVAERMKLLAKFGIPSGEEAAIIGGNNKMNEMQAAMGLCNLRHAAEYIALRKHVSDRYDDRFADVRGLRILKDRAGVTRNYAYYPLFIEAAFGAKRDEVLAALNAENIFPRRYFHPAVNRMACYQHVGRSGETPVSDELSDTVLCLPMHAALTDGQVDAIAHIVRKAGGRA